ncbi:DUF6514 family protein [Clostridium tarantellae]|uniref:Uncharacterized protein n=1 Tax=Clostridium tarantellae TaxID=39493 RepID=A0A6I1MIE5_9CLOT|nr:DUF6514 family protein [Clostridium tarantellae]MPQ43135.1 hypothetical protein [Clostridium tarantellae]
MKVIRNLCNTVEVGEIKYKYFYRLTKTKFRNTDAYGIEVERQDVVGNELINIERDSIEKITCKLEKVENLIKLLYDYNVSPMHLIDILGEYVDEYILDFDKCA